MHVTALDALYMSIIVQDVERYVKRYFRQVAKD